MPIRTRNLDLKSDYVGGHESVVLGDITATRSFIAFVAPVPCVIDYIDVYSRQAVAGASSVTLVIAAADGVGGSSIASRSTSATAAGADSNSISAGARYRLVASSNNSFSLGRAMDLTFTLGTTAVTSGVHVHVIYTPLLHRESR